MTAANDPAHAGVYRSVGSEAAYALGRTSGSVRRWRRAGPKIGAVAVWSAHLPILRNSFPQRNQINVDSRACRRVSLARPVPFSRAGLPLTARLRADPDDNVETTFTCTPERLLIRLRVTFDSTGNAAAATVVVANAGTGRRIALVREQPPQLYAYTAPVCRHR